MTLTTDINDGNGLSAKMKEPAYLFSTLDGRDNIFGVAH